MKQQKMAGEHRRSTDSRDDFATLKDFYTRNKRMPSYSELAKLLRFRSKFAAQYVVKKWIEAGLVLKDSAGRLIPGSAFYPLKVLGSIKAGWPSPAEEEMVDTISLDDWLIPNKEASFMLKVSGDSMIDAGIRPGDLVIVHRGKQPKSGDIVIAEVDSEWTLKYFVRESVKAGVSWETGTRVVLKAANKKYAPIVPREELKIGGVVTSVIRKY